jgi:FkbM family methyltransferase
MIESIKSILRRARSSLGRDPDGFLRGTSGVIHVGANSGQERDLYAKFGLRVVWIEPITEVFEALKANLKDYPRQRAVECLVTDQEGAEYPFHIASNSGASSSILDLHHHREIWPGIAYEKKITLRSKTLASLLRDEQIDPSAYDSLFVTTQGSELLVLKGAAPILRGLTYIKTRVPDFEAYKDCCQIADVASFLARYEYKEFSRHLFARRPGGGSYFDVVYRRPA